MGTSPTVVAQHTRRDQGSPAKAAPVRGGEHLSAGGEEVSARGEKISARGEKISAGGEEISAGGEKASRSVPGSWAWCLAQELAEFVLEVGRAAEDPFVRPDAEPPSVAYG